MNASQGNLMVFCKAPEPGYVKTRLAKSIGDDLAALLHEKLSLHCLKKASGFDSINVELWCSPSINHPFFLEYAQKYGIILKQQGSGNLGERMSQAFASALSNYEYAIAIGTDCPVIDHDYLLQAINVLSGVKEPVIGPAEDGGYVLLGLREHKPTYFENIAWGSSSVLEKTLKRLPKHTVILPTMWDIDTVDDLRRLYQQRDNLKLSNELKSLLNTIKF